VTGRKAERLTAGGFQRPAMTSAFSPTHRSNSVTIAGDLPIVWKPTPSGIEVAGNVKVEKTLNPRVERPGGVCF